MKLQDITIKPNIEDFIYNIIELKINQCIRIRYVNVSKKIYNELGKNKKYKVLKVAQILIMCKHNVNDCYVEFVEELE